MKYAHCALLLNGGQCVAGRPLCTTIIRCLRNRNKQVNGQIGALGKGQPLSGAVMVLQTQTGDAQLVSGSGVNRSH